MPYRQASMGRAAIQYRILMLDLAGVVIATNACEAATDADALAAARAWLGRYPAVEVWQGSRVVATLTAAGDGASHPGSET